jgi:RNA polymerase sigma-70 factor, ECF subfamily
MIIIRRAAIDAMRHDRSRPRLTAERGETGDPGAPSPEGQAIARETGDGLRATLDRLPEAQAEVIQLAFFGELSHREIARQLDLPPGTVKGRMRLGLEKLRSDVERG